MIYSWEGEDLWTHSSLVARAGRCLFPDEVELYNEKVSSMAGRRADWWLLTALLHDVGKAHRAFQRQPYKYFMCHEVYSAAFAYRALERYGEVAHVIAVAVLLHHHAMERIEKCVNIEMFNPVEELRDYASKVSHTVGIELSPWKNIDIRHVLKILVKNTKAYKTALIAIMPLIAGDNFAAYGRNEEVARILCEIFAEHQARFNTCLTDVEISRRIRRLQGPGCSN